MHKQVLVIYYSDSGSTREAAEILAGRFNTRPINVIDITKDYELKGDFIIFCTPNKYGKPAKPMLDFITNRRKQLKEFQISVCFTCMDCYDFPADEQRYTCSVFKDSYFKEQTKSAQQMNSWEKSHSVHSYLEVLKNYLPEPIHSIAFFKGKLSFKELTFFDAFIMRFISMIRSNIRQGYYLRKEDLAAWGNELTEKL